MARIRTIKPEFCQSPSTAALTLPARLFFLQLLTETDDAGLLVYSAKRLAGCLYPHDDGVTAAKVERWIKECIRQDMLRPYEVDGKRYLAVVNFSRHQRVSHPTPSRIPPPDYASDSREPPEDDESDSGLEVGSRGLEVGDLVTSPPPPTVVAADGAEEDDRSAGRLKTLAEASLARFEATGGQIHTSREGWLRTERKRRIDEDDWSEPEPLPAPAAKEPHPIDAAADAQRRLAAENDAKRRGRGCPVCDASGWLDEGGSGVVPCPTCDGTGLAA